MDEAGEILLILFKNQSANYVNFTLPTKLQPVAGFLVCTLIFIGCKFDETLYSLYPLYCPLYGA